MRPMKCKLASEIRYHRPLDLRLSRHVSEIAVAQPLHLLASHLVHRRCLLLVVYAEAGKEPWHPQEPEPSGLRAQDEVPIERVIERFVQRTDLVPDPPPPEQRLLRQVIRPDQCFRIVRRQDGTANLESV